MVVLNLLKKKKSSLQQVVKQLKAKLDWKVKKKSKQRII